MKKENIKYIALFIIALLLGLLGGFLLFGGQNSTSSIEENHDQHKSVQDSSTEEQIWTCSMHPQIRQNELSVCPICEMDLIPLESNTSNDPLVLQMTEEAVKLANIQTTIVGGDSENSSKMLRLSGKIQADERRASSQVAHVPGRIEKLYVSFTGEQVYKGQKLADVYSPELISAQQELIEALKLIQMNPGLVIAARNKLKYLKISQDVIEDIEKEGKVKEIFSIYADRSGIVSNRRVSVGDYIKTGATLYELINLSKVWVLFDAYEEDLSLIKVGDKIKFTTASFPSQEFSSRINFIDPLIDPKTRTTVLRAELNNTKGLLKPEMFVKGEVDIKIKGNKLISVPKSAVMWTGKRSVVYVKLPEHSIPSYQFREVELGESFGDTYLIKSGLEVDEEVVTYGNFVIDAAAQLNNQASMMNRNVKLKTETVEQAPNFQEATPEKFKNQLHAVTHSYIQLKNAFVATDEKEAADEANTFLTKLDEVEMSLVKGDAHIFWMEQLSALKVHGEKIKTATDVEEQRKQFGFLSDVLITTIDAFGSTGEPVYVQFCPMAFDNEGADWLSLEKEIKNPYFGDKMMKCGILKDTL
jgi:Cu(I)/Ag(I) efflux system membrane fusion protein